MLIIDCPDHFAETMAKAVELDREYDYKFGLVSDLLKQLAWVSSFGDHDLKGDSKNHLCYDSSPLSFVVNCVRGDGAEAKNWYTLGLVFHNGSGSMSDGSFSVELDAPSGPHWMVHS